MFWSVLSYCFSQQKKDFKSQKKKSSIRTQFIQIKAESHKQEDLDSRNQTSIWKIQTISSTRKPSKARKFTDPKNSRSFREEHSRGSAGKVWAGRRGRQAIGHSSPQRLGRLLHRRRSQPRDSSNSAAHLKPRTPGAPTRTEARRHRVAPNLFFAENWNFAREEKEKASLFVFSVLNSTFQQSNNNNEYNSFRSLYLEMKNTDWGLVFFLLLLFYYFWIEIFLLKFRSNVVLAVCIGVVLWDWLAGMR